MREDKLLDITEIPMFVVNEEGCCREDQGWHGKHGNTGNLEEVDCRGSLQ
jgi:hypothetical protein